jgi:hypothetical protein
MFRTLWLDDYRTQRRQWAHPPFRHPHPLRASRQEVIDMVDLHTNDTLVRTRMAEDVQRAALYRLRRQRTAGGRRFLRRLLAVPSAGPAIPGRHDYPAFELDRAA